MTTERERPEAIKQYAERNVQLGRRLTDMGCGSIMLERLERTISVLPDEVADMFLSGRRCLKIVVEPDRGLPSGMRTTAEGPPDDRRYTIVVYKEHLDWPEDLFLGALLRELGHVAGNRPPESEWPSTRSERAGFKEMLENRADATVWRWGLRHYNMRYLAATFPPHRFNEIVAAIEQLMVEH